MTNSLLTTIEDIARDEREALQRLCSLMEDPNISGIVSQWQEKPPSEIAAFLKAIGGMTVDEIHALPDYQN